MFALDAGQTLVAKLRGPARQPARRRTLVPATQGAVAAELVQPAAERIGRLAGEAGSTLGFNVNDLGRPQCQPPALSIGTKADQELIPLRRGDDLQPTPYEILGPMESGPAYDSAAADSPDGVSAFIARVLDQLTLSAWLPAAVLTASVAILLQFRSDRSANTLTAVRALTADPVRVLVLMVPLLVVATVVTQAFSFEAITTLEGYWYRRGPANLARTLMIRRHVRRKEAIKRRCIRATERAFYAAEPRMLRDGIPFPIVNAVKALALGVPEPPLTDEETNRLNGMDWQCWSDAWLISKVEHLSRQEKTYPPETYRVLPTRLGNLMRATEDQLKHTEGDVQGFALRRYATAPRLVQKEHDQFRNRLEMYSTLVFVSASLLILAPIVLLGSGIGFATVAIIAGGFAALSEASYLAAIASAAGYCSALREMDEDIPNSGGKPKASVIGA
jgi:hypothetical protein